MTKFPTQETVIDTVIQGIAKAAQSFLFWTNGRLHVSQGPEKIISIHVAQEIASIPDAPEIFIDATIADVLRCSLPDRSAYAEFMYENRLTQGVFSITLDERFKHENNDDSISKVIMNIRNGVRNPKLKYLDEIETMCKMLVCKSTLEYGIFAFYSDLSSNARKKLNIRMPALVESFEAVVERFPALTSSFVGGEIHTLEDGGEWTVGCFVVSPK